MAEMNHHLVDGSEDSPLLSQDTFSQLLSQLDNPVNSFMNYNMTAVDIPTAQDFPSLVTAMDIPTAQEFPSPINDMNNFNADIYSSVNIASAQEQIRILSSATTVPSSVDHLQSVHHTSIPEQKPVLSSLPACENWPGTCGFSVSFNAQQNAKGITWIYSTLKKKLFVSKDTPCPINFSTNIPLADVSIRVMAVFSSADHANQWVHRCPNHSIPEQNRGVLEHDHLIRCESSMARYEKDPQTERRSVVVPFENPPAGQSFSSYIFKFTCFSSCSGGPNRRPLMLVFTLEKRNEVIGRFKVDLKICACPGRDLRIEEKQMCPDQPKVPVKRKEHVTASGLMPDSCSSKEVKTSKKVKEEKGPYILKVKDRKCYEILKQVKRYYEVYSVIKQHLPNEWECFIHSSSLSSDEDKSDN